MPTPQIPSRGRSWIPALLVWSLALPGCTRTAEESFRRGIHFLSQAQYQRARIEFRDAIRKNPASADAYYQYAVACMELQEYQAAGRALQVAEEGDRKLGPYSLDIRLRLGRLLLYHREFEGARRRAQWILARDKNHLEARELLAFALAGLGQSEPAAEEITDLLARQPANVPARMLQAAVQVSALDAEQARVTLEEAVRQSSRAVVAMVALGHLHVLAGRFPQAEAQYREAIATHPQEPGPRRALGWLLARLDRRLQAEILFREVRRLRPDDPESRGTLATYYLYLRDWKAAIAELEDLAKQREDKFNRTRLAAAYFLSGQADNAGRLSRELQREDINNITAHIVRGLLHLQAERTEEAAREFNQALQRQPQSAVLHYFLGLTAAQQHTDQRAQQAMGRALELDPSLMVARLWLAENHIQRGAGAAALSVLRTAPPEQRQAPLLRMLLAQAYSGIKEDATARLEVQGVLAQYSGAVADFYEMGFATLLDRHSDLARQAAEAALQKDPASLALLRVAAHALMVEGKTAEALARVERQAPLLRNPTTSPEYLLLLGEAQLRAGKLSQARSTMQNAAVLLPDSPDPVLGLVQVELSAKNLPAARAHAASLVARWPASANAWVWLGSIHEAERNYRAATQAYEQAIAKDGRNAVALNNLAWRLMTDAADMSNMSRALVLAQRARELDPANPSFADTLGWIYYRMGSHHFAEGVLQDAVRRAPKMASYHFHLGMVLSETGNDEQALASLQTALRLNPQLPDGPAAQKRMEEIRERMLEREGESTSRRPRRT
jgi:tetratricopeptide (TPR) repeat protein